MRGEAHGESSPSISRGESSGDRVLHTPSRRYSATFREKRTVSGDI